MARSRTRQPSRRALRDVDFVDRLLRRHERELREQTAPPTRRSTHYGPYDFVTRVGGRDAEPEPIHESRRPPVMPGHIPDTRSSRERRAAQARQRAGKKGGTKKAQVPQQRGAKREPARKQ